MPEVFRAEGFVFFFFSNEGHEPVHVHVRKAGGYAKYWIDPVGLEFARAMKVKDLSRAEELIIENVDKIRERWNEVFNL